MTDFVIVPAAISAQTLKLPDGSSLLVELSSPQIVWGLMQRDGDSISVRSLHASEEEAETHLAVAERAEGGTLQ